MEKIICFSASGKAAYNNFLKTVAKPSILDKNILDGIKINYDQNSLFSVWAMKFSRKNEMLWKKINSGDVAIFYGYKKFIGYGNIIGTMRSDELAVKFFNDSIFSLIIFLEPVKTVESSRDKMWEIFNYSTIGRIQGMRIPNIQVQWELMDKHNDINQLVDYVLDIKEKAL